MFSLIWGLPLAAGVVLAIREKESLVNPLALIMSIGLLASFYWLSRFEMQFTSSEIRYRSWFHPPRGIKYDDISSIQIAPRRNEPPFLVVVTSKSGMPELRINSLSLIHI